MTDSTAKKPVEQIQKSAQQAAKAETTSRPTRNYRTYLFQFALIVITGAFALLTFLVKTTPSFPIDLAITRFIQSINLPFFDTFMYLISWPGYPPQSFILSAVVILIIYVLGLRWEAIVGLLAAILPAAIDALVKGYIRRPRPTVDLVHVFRILNSYSFPSGHVMFYVGFFGYLWFLAYTLLKQSRRRTFLLGLYGILILLVGVSRIYLGQHWPSDVLGAYLLGSLTLVAIIQFYRWGKTRYFVHQPVAPEAPKTAEKQVHSG
jgi:membrane-associated phospholipid phosphatase